MNKTIKRQSDKYLTVSADTLAAMLNCGRSTAVRIGEEAGAKIQIGRRTLYKLDRIDKYLEALTEESN